METILVSKVIAKDGKKPWKVLDGNAVEYATWDDTIGTQAQALVDQQAKIEVEVTEKTGRDGVVFVNRLLQKIEKAEPERAQRGGDYEPSVNFGKQVVIIRQNAWAQTNAIYDKAVALYKHSYAASSEEFASTLDVQAVHAIAWQLYSPNKRPENSNMFTIAHDIEVTIRQEWFPLTDDEIPF